MMSNQLKQIYQIPSLPPAANIETQQILKLLPQAHRLLGELKGKATAIPNQTILINSLAMQEAKASSEIENVVTTQDEIFQVSADSARLIAGPAKEVALYRDALMQGHRAINQRGGNITKQTIVEMFQILKGNSGEFRKTPGTALKNDSTGEIVYVPPQQPDEIERHMADLDEFMNDDQTSELDPLIKVAIIHHQFESIHPFPDGNGRVGRIINVLYLTRTGLLDIPILYLSRYINQNKSEYYSLLQDVRDHGHWEEWVKFMLCGIIETSKSTLELVEGIRDLMAQSKQRMRANLPKIYSQDLLNNIFRQPYTRIEYVENDLNITRPTATRHLEMLVEHDFLHKIKHGRSNYYVNFRLAKLLTDLSG